MMHFESDHAWLFVQKNRSLSGNLIVQSMAQKQCDTKFELFFISFRKMKPSCHISCLKLSILFN